MQPNPASYQGFQFKENLVHSPNQVFGAASSRPEQQAAGPRSKQQALQFHPSVGSAGNTSSHGSESSFTCPARQQEKKAVNNEESSDSSEEEVRRAPRINWS